MYVCMSALAEVMLKAATTRFARATRSSHVPRVAHFFTTFKKDDSLLQPNIQQYIEDVSVRESEAASALRQETADHPRAIMQISADQGQLMSMLVKLTGAKRAIEVGVFTGYSSLVTAEALPADGMLVACDISEEYTAIARKHWQHAGVESKINLKIGPALDTLDALLAAGQACQFDFAFIDADKGNYDHYYERCLQLVRPGGLVVLDNMLWKGRVVNDAIKDKQTRTIRALNTKLHSDGRVDIALLPVCDGMFLARKR